MLLQPVILCGSSSTRLWPVSRASHPKQLPVLLGGETMMQATPHRLEGFTAATLAGPLGDIESPIDHSAIMPHARYRWPTAGNLAWAMA